MQFRAEAFNLTNKTNYGDPNTSYSGTCPINNPNCNSFGVINSLAGPGREMQFAGKIVF